MNTIETGPSNNARDSRASRPCVAIRRVREPLNQDRLVRTKDQLRDGKLPPSMTVCCTNVIVEA
jgi:hypothetical protein